MKRKQKTQRKKMQEGGITLIALVITIVILIILATVTLNVVLGEGGLIQRAQQAKDLTEQASIEEQEELNSLMSEMTNILSEEEVVLDPDSIEAVLKEGDYVEYVDGKGQTRNCVVLYDYENEDYDDYGIQIITMEGVEPVVLSPEWMTAEDETESMSDFPTLRDNYNNIVEILNTKAEAYVNDEYAVSARSVGTLPDNPSYDTNEYFVDNENEWFQEYNNVFKVTDNRYEIDYNQMEKLGILPIETTTIYNQKVLVAGYYLSSRATNTGTLTNYDETYNSFSILRVGHNSTNIIKTEMVYLSDYNYSGGDVYFYSSGCIASYLRPVITLKPGLTVVSGEGTSENPYKLSNT